MPKQHQYINQFDYFGQTIPQLTYKGHTKVGTPFGLLGTVLFTLCLLIFGASKFVHLVTFKNPLITKASESEKHLTVNDTIDLDSTNFQVAFAVEDMKTGESLDDPYYVEWYGAIWESDGISDEITQKIGVHKCSAEDMKKFHPVGNRSKHKINTLLGKEALWCLNEVDTDGRPINKKLYGSSDAQPNRNLAIVFAPCVPQQLTSNNKKYEKTECMANYTDSQSMKEREQKSKSYLTHPNLVMVFNKEFIDITKFGHDSIVKTSEVMNI